MQNYLLSELNQLTAYHKTHCEEYAKLLQLFYPQQEHASSLEEVPYLPVSLFKTTKLISVAPEAVFKVLKSSGTTSSTQSQIYLDVATAKRQTEAFSQIITSLIGPQRLPLLIIDHPQVIEERFNYSARGAALIGMMTFGRDPFFALNEDMSLNQEGMAAWLKKYENEKILIFGMTFIIWKYFLLQTNNLSLQKGILIHTGGWKKMEEEAITNQLFKAKVFEKTKIRSCHNFYGMVEQTGTVFLECQEGHLHSPPFGDVIIRDPITWKPTKNKGVIQLLSLLPTSYPGHSLLTEDLGILVDKCPCGRSGFLVLGRIPQAEIRGCSDSYN